MIAVIITILVLDLKVPQTASLASLRPILPTFFSYVLSFVYVGIYWNNHHHLLQAAERVNGRILWANLHLLFWLSLTPFGTAWMGQSQFASWPVAFYGLCLLGAAIAYYILSQALVRHHGEDSVLAKAIGQDRKGMLSLVYYLSALPLAFVSPLWSCVLYVVVAIMWLLPDPRIEERLH